VIDKAVCTKPATTELIRPPLYLSTVSQCSPKHPDQPCLYTDLEQDPDRWRHRKVPHSQLSAFSPTRLLLILIESSGLLLLPKTGLCISASSLVLSIRVSPEPRQVCYSLGPDRLYTRAKTRLIRAINCRICLPMAYDLAPTPISP